MTDVTIGGSTYRIGRLDAMRQFHVARRVAPLIASADLLRAIAGTTAPPEGAGNGAAAGVEAPAGGSAVSAGGGAAVSQGTSAGDLAALLGPVLQQLAATSDADCEYVIGTCLAVVRRQQPNGGWAPVWNVAAKRPMFEDIQLPDLLNLTVQVIQENIGGFFAAVPSS